MDVSGFPLKKMKRSYLKSFEIQFRDLAFENNNIYAFILKAIQLFDANKLIDWKESTT